MSLQHQRSWELVVVCSHKTVLLYRGLGTRALLLKHLHLNTQGGVVGGLDFGGAGINPDPAGPWESFANVLGMEFLSRHCHQGWEGKDNSQTVSVNKGLERAVNWWP